MNDYYGKQLKNDYYGKQLKNNYYGKQLKYMHKIKKILQVGGSDAFYVFVTGIISWNLSDDSPFHYFTHNLLEKISEIIFRKSEKIYNNLIIHSYDPTINDPARSDDDKITLSLKISDATAELDFKIATIMSLYSRDISFVHHNDAFEHDETINSIMGVASTDAGTGTAGAVGAASATNNNYIVIDIAHLYHYTNDIHKVILAPYYGNRPRDLNIVSIYGNYFYNKDDVDDSICSYEFNPRWINHTDFFRVFNDGSVWTYFDTMLFKGFGFTDYQYINPGDKIMNIYEKTRIMIVDDLKKPGMSLDDAMKLFIPKSIIITRQIIDMIMYSDINDEDMLVTQIVALHME